MPARSPLLSVRPIGPSVLVWRRTWMSCVLLLVCTGSVLAQKLADQELFIHAPVDEVWTAFTTEAGLRNCGFPAATVDLRVGGRFEVYSPPSGKPVTASYEILAYDPERMLALRAARLPENAPLRTEQLRDRWVILYFDAAGPATTHIRIGTVAGGAQTDSAAAWLMEQQRALADAVAKRYWPKCAKCAAEDVAN